MKWIDVKDRLPEFDEVVLVCYPIMDEKQYEVGIGFLDHAKEGLGYKNLSWEYSNGVGNRVEGTSTIVAWAVLPEAIPLKAREQ